ncbi:mechanosensitive ion channel family protein [Sphingobacterium rhinopitheci]|uniref:mechanosensitive ion channel family protein n=1 Tax=Sphingobacterium rhinopitheci TaxID=2781960 RepID=UPI001F519DF2|nr:mechanosensitive ion channel domain-containing protein [Sphingobacterium rhinopitheci]MCI0920088.1 mechanosensitive ion channel [Sphingobacterium rhinopitheci]
MEQFDIQTRIEKLIDLVVLKVPEVVAAIVILIIGKYVIRFAISLIQRRFERRNFDKSVSGFILSLIRFIFYGLLILTVASTVGIQTTSFIAVLSAFGLAIGLSLQGSLANFAGGVLILIFRPFEVGDYIDSANGSTGTVDKIDLLYTAITDDNGIRVFSPNGTLANSVIRNFTKVSSRRFQFIVGISYDDNIKIAKEAILEVLKNDPNMNQEPAPDVFVGDLADSSINLTIRGWVKREVYWLTVNNLREKIKIALDEQGISIPYPQTEMSIKNNPFPKDIS